MNLVQKIFLNNSFILAEKVFSSIISFLISVWLVRYLGTERYGIYSLVFAYLSILNLFTPNTLDKIVAREGSKEPDKLAQFLGAGILLKTLLGLAGIVAGLFLAFTLGYERNVFLFLLIILISLIANAGNVLEVPFQIEVHLFPVGIIEASMNLLYQALRVVLILLKASLLPFFLIYSLFRFLQMGIMGLFLFKKKGLKPEFRFRKRELKLIISGGIPLLVNHIFIMVLVRIDQLMLYSMRSKAELGIYASAVNLVDYWIIIPEVWYLTIFPLLCKAKGTDDPLLWKESNFYSFKYLSLFSLSFFLLAGSFSKELMVLIYGADFAPGWVALTLLSLSLVWLFINFGLFQIVIAKSKEWSWVWFNFSGMVINILLNLILIPRYGISGASLASLFAYSAPLFFIWLLPELRSEISTLLSAVGIPFILSSALVLFSNLAGLKLFPGAFVIVFCYILSLLLFGVLNRKDLQILYVIFGYQRGESAKKT